MIYFHSNPGVLLGAAATQPVSFSMLEQALVGNDAVYRLLTACGLGTLIGIERELKSRSAGVRTNLLICVGCAFFTLLSQVIAGDNSPNKGQIAANIVQGIGFLGAGLILHNRDRVSGLASAASIFVVASIGMACGAGLFAPAVIATIIVLVALALVGFVEWRVNLKAYSLIYEARGRDSTGMLTSILDAMDRDGQRLSNIERDAIGSLERVSFSVNTTKRRHELLSHYLKAEPSIDAVKTFRDPEAD